MLAQADFAYATPSPELIRTQQSGQSGRMFLPPDFPELQLFALLKSQFGHPNGLMTYLLERKQGDPNAAFKWDFIFIPCGNLILHIMRGSAGIEVWWWGEPATEADVVAYLRNNIARYQEVIAKTISGLERHTLILNPYVRHRSVAEFALEEMNLLHPAQPTPPNAHVERPELGEYVKKLNEFLQAVDRQAALMMLLVTESAFMAESFLNLLLALLMRKDIRESKAIMTETLMRKWKSKIERLHVDCVLIPKPANMGDARIGNAQKMFNIRNRVAHSYPDKEEMAVGQMWFYNCFPVLETGVPFANFAITLHNQLPSLEEARFCKKAADELITLLTDLVDQSHRDEIKFVSGSNPLGYNETKGMYSVPFGKSIIMSVTMSCEPMADTARVGGLEVTGSESKS